MKRVTTLHLQAMEEADKGDRARRKGRERSALGHFRKALALEAKAASLVEADFEQEPTRSILHRSAATLAIQCGEHRQAERIIASALRGTPPVEVADELRDLLEDVNFNRHLDARGVKLAHNELQLSLSGAGIGFGMAPSDQVLRRIGQVEKLLVRTAERLQGKEYRERGMADKDVRHGLEVYLSTPRAASFAVTFRIGSGQLELFPGDGAARVIEETLSDLELRVHDASIGVAFEAVGRLQFADSVGNANKIKLVDKKDQTHSITVPPGMMGDIVRPLWDDVVRVRGRPFRSGIMLEQIERVNSPDDNDRDT